jgi:hypothetical protein
VSRTRKSSFFKKENGSPGYAFKAKKKGVLETSVREEPPHDAVLQEDALLDPEVANESLPTIVNPLNEIRWEGCHLPSEGEDEWEGGLNCQSLRLDPL